MGNMKAELLLRERRVLEAKGDHRHKSAKAMPYVFVSVDQLLDDFLADVAT
jgi:hypothetical protein